MVGTLMDCPSSPPCGKIAALPTAEDWQPHSVWCQFAFPFNCHRSPSQEEAVRLSTTVFSTYNHFPVSLGRCRQIVRSHWSVSVRSLSLLLDFFPKAHGEGGHCVGGQHGDGAAHKVWGAAPPGRTPPAPAVDVLVCRLHSVRQGLHASSREGALHFLWCRGAFPVVLTNGFFICSALLDKDVKSPWVHPVPGDTGSSVLSRDCQGWSECSGKEILWGWSLIIIEQTPAGSSLCFYTIRSAVMSCRHLDEHSLTGWSEGQEYCYS